MRLRILISLSALLLSWQHVDAQLLPADDFFHGGAQFYLSNNVPKALEIVTNGRAIYPDDIKLKKLEELLKQQQQQNQNQQQNKQDQNQQQHQKSDEQKQQEQAKADQQKKEQEQQKQSGKSSQEQEEQQEAEQQQAQAGPMTEQQAKQLLDAQKRHEHVLIFKPTGEKEKTRTKTLKDW